MAETPKRRANVSDPEASRVTNPVRPAASSVETSRAADSVPASVGPFTVLPHQFGRYRIDKLLGKGMMGAVYLAQDVQLDRPVALKVARVSTSGASKIIKRMETEAKAAAKLDHPQICKVYDFGEIEGIRFIALQFIEGEDLKTYMKREGRRRDPVEAVTLVLKIVRAVSEAHKRDVLHRDLKPENIMLNRTGEPVIMDFGLARRATGSTDAGLTQGMIVGTAAYMSPEQAIGKADEIDHRTDLYAIGVMLFELLTGEWPFTGSAIEVMGKKCVQEPPSPLDLNSNLPPQLATICHKMIAKQKDDRYGSSSEIAAALEGLDLKIESPLIRRNIANVPATADKSDSVPEFLSSSSETPSVRQKPSQTRKKSQQKSSSNRLAQLTAWWNSLKLTARWMAIGGAAAFLVALAAVLFIPTSAGVVRIEIDDPTLSVKLDGNLITIDNGGQPIRVKPTKKHTLEVLQNDVAIESATREITLKSGDTRIVTVKLLDGAVTIDGQPVVAQVVNGKSHAALSDQKIVTDPSELAAVARGKWIRLVDAKTELPNPDSMKFYDGILEMDSTGFQFPQIEYRDVVIRAKVCKLTGNNLWFSLRGGGVKSYSAWFNGANQDGGDLFGMGIPDKSSRYRDVLCTHTGTRIQPEEFVEIAFAVIGENLAMYLNGKKILTVNNNEVSSGFVAIGAGRGKSMFKEVEYQTLDPADASILATPHTGLRNGDFSRGFDNWVRSGTTERFVVFSTEGHKALTTAPLGTGRIEDKGSLTQTFIVSPNASRLECFLHGSSSPQTYVALFERENLIWKQSGPNRQQAQYYSCDITHLRGKQVTFNIVDDSAAAYGYLGVHGIRIIE